MEGTGQYQMRIAENPDSVVTQSQNGISEIAKRCFDVAISLRRPILGHHKAPRGYATLIPVHTSQIPCPIHKPISDYILIPGPGL